MTQSNQTPPTVSDEKIAEMQYRKKPVVIDAIKWTGDNLRAVITFTDGPPDTRSMHAGMKWDEYADLVAREGLMIYTLEDGHDQKAKHFATVGDWIVRGVKGELYPIKPDIFEATYDPVGAANDTDKRLSEIRSHIGQSIVREIDAVTLSVDDALFMHSLASTGAREGGE